MGELDGPQYCRYVLGFENCCHGRNFVLQSGYRGEGVDRCPYVSAYART